MNGVWCMDILERVIMSDIFFKIVATRPLSKIEDVLFSKLGPYFILSISSQDNI